MSDRKAMLVTIAACTLLSCGGGHGGSGAAKEDEERDPPEVVLGERLFRVTQPPACVISATLFYDDVAAPAAFLRALNEDYE